jgi:hypothetical protein
VLSRYSHQHSLRHVLRNDAREVVDRSRYRRIMINFKRDASAVEIHVAGDDDTCRRMNTFDYARRIARRPFVTLICGFLGMSNGIRDRVTVQMPLVEHDHTKVDHCFIGSVGGHQSPYQGWRRMQSPLV